MRTIIMEPGQKWPRIVALEDVSSVRVAVGGYLDARQYRWRGRDLMIVTRCDAEASGAAPNRIVDGHLLYGTIVVAGDGLTNLPLAVAKDLQSDCEWPMVQLETYQPEACGDQSL